MLENQIKDLVRLWYDVIGHEHHKDRDCHWYIETHYKYSGELTYEIVHGGYILGDVTDTYTSYREAEEGLARTIYKAVEERIDCATLHADDWSGERKIEVLDNIKEWSDRLGQIKKEFCNARFSHTEG